MLALALVTAVGGPVSVLAPSTALAADTQPGPSVEEPPRVQAIRAVERGFFLETDVGASLIVNKIHDRQYGLSVLTGLFAGYDILPILSISAGAYGMGASLSSSDPTATSGDLFFVIPTAQLQLALITTERNFFSVRGGIGYAFGLPSKINGVSYGGNGVAFSGALAFERYTKLRHFSIGVMAGVVGVTQPGLGVGVSVTPTLKYTF